MDGTGLLIYQLVRNKDYDWVDQVVTQLRLYASWIYPPDKTSLNRSYLDCKQPMTKIEKKFKPKSDFYKCEYPFQSLPIMFKIVNELSEMLIQSPPRCEVKATDPTAISGKKEDLNILRTRTIYSKGINKSNKMLGQPPQQVDISNVNSNIQDFDKLKLNDQDEEDISIFEEYFQKAYFEIAAQEVINNSMKVNKFDEFNLRDAFRDIASSNALCYDAYVDEITGAQVIQKIRPEEAVGIFGEAYDGSEDICRGWQRLVPLRDFLGLVGNKFKFDRDWTWLLWAINGANNFAYTGFAFNDGVTLDTWSDQQNQYSNFHTQYGCNGSNILPINQAWHYKVYVGKLEWFAPDTIGNNYMVDRVTNAVQVTQVNFDDYDKNDKLKEKYDYKSEWKWKAYNATYLAYTTSSQKIFTWGEVYLQQPDGANDQYCIGTMKFYRLPGDPIGKIIQPYIDIANEAFYKVKWILSNAKPRAKQVVFNEIIAMARALGTEKNGLLNKDGNVSNSGMDLLESVFNYMKENVEYDIRFYPQVRGQDVPQLPSLRDPDQGIDPLYQAMALIERWAEEQVADKIGLNDLRLANIKNAREGFKQQQMETEFSKNQTAYISRMIQFVKKDIATTLLLYTHDVIKFKQSLACKWIETLIGEEKFKWLQTLGNYAPHRMGVFINDYNTQEIKAEVNKLVDIALQKGMQGQEGGITLPQAYFIKRAEDFKLEMKLLDIFIRREKKRKLKEQVMLEEQRHNNVMQELQKQQEVEQMRLQAGIQEKTIDSNARKYEADKAYQGKMDSTSLRENNVPNKTAAKTEGAKEVASHKENLKEQQPA